MGIEPIFDVIARYQLQFSILSGWAATCQCVVRVGFEPTFSTAIFLLCIRQGEYRTMFGVKTGIEPVNT
jgi:hypothetical protein